MNCPNCNCKIKKNVKFCPKCGTEISQDFPSQENTNNTNENGKKSLKFKIWIIVGISLLVLAIFFLIAALNNFFCIFSHQTTCKIVEPTCTIMGHTEYQCKYCSHCYRCDETESIGHDIGNAKCGDGASCLRCGQTVKYHMSNKEDKCKNCGVKKYNISLPITPSVINNYAYNGDLLGTIIITNLKIEDTEINFTVKRAYQYRGLSEKAKIVWKLYDENNAVVTSGTAYSDATIAIGETTTGDFSIYGIEDWSAYRLVFLDYVS